MIRHVVMWRLKPVAEGRSKEENILIVKKMLESLPSKVTEILSLRVVLNILHDKASYDLMLTAEFADLDALHKYQKHEEHVKVADYVGAVRQERAVVDFQV